MNTCDLQDNFILDQNLFVLIESDQWVHFDQWIHVTMHVDILFSCHLYTNQKQAESVSFLFVMGSDFSLLTERYVIVSSGMVLFFWDLIYRNVFTCLQGIPQVPRIPCPWHWIVCPWQSACQAARCHPCLALQRFSGQDNGSVTESREHQVQILTKKISNLTPKN